MRFLNKRMLMIALVLGAALLAPQWASAEYRNMISATAADETINSAIFSVTGGGSGTGIFPSFVQIGGNANQTQAYNTTVNGTLDNGSADQHNHEIQAGNIAVKNIGGTLYFVFELDINENKNDKDKYLSLDKLQIYTSNTPNQSTTDPTKLGTLRYDMGAGNGILLNFENQAGSGNADMVVYIPVWAGVDKNDFVYLYSAFGSVTAAQVAAATSGGVANPGPAPGGQNGADYGNSDGFEEWAESIGGSPLSPVPAPASLLLAATGIGGLGLARFRRMLRRGPLAA